MKPQKAQITQNVYCAFLCLLWLIIVCNSARNAELQYRPVVADP